VTVTVTADDGSASAGASQSLDAGSTAQRGAAEDNPPNNPLITFYFAATHHIAQTTFGKARSTTRT
jgi:hypothetical protein